MGGYNEDKEKDTMGIKDFFRKLFKRKQEELEITVEETDVKIDDILADIDVYLGKSKELKKKIESLDESCAEEVDKLLAEAKLKNAVKRKKNEPLKDAQGRFDAERKKEPYGTEASTNKSLEVYASLSEECKAIVGVVSGVMKGLETEKKGIIASKEDLDKAKQNLIKLEAKNDAEAEKNQAELDKLASIIDAKAKEIEEYNNTVNAYAETIKKGEEAAAKLEEVKQEMSELEQKFRDDYAACKTPKEKKKLQKKFDEEMEKIDSKETELTAVVKEGKKAGVANWIYEEDNKSKIEVAEKAKAEKEEEQKKKAEAEEKRKEEYEEQKGKLENDQAEAEGKIKESIKKVEELKKNIDEQRSAYKTAKKNFENEKTDNER